jgi:hypothetical protein
MRTCTQQRHGLDLKFANEIFGLARQILEVHLCSFLEETEMGLGMCFKTKSEILTPGNGA